MAGNALQVASSVLRTLWSTTDTLFGTISRSPNSPKQTIMGNAQSRSDRSTRLRTCGSAEVLTRTNEHQSCPSQADIQIGRHDPSRARVLQRSRSAPNIAETNNRYLRTPMEGMGSPSPEFLPDHESNTENPITSGSEAVDQRCMPPSNKKIRFASAKEMWSVIGGRYVGAVTDNEWKASNKTFPRTGGLGNDESVV